MKSITKDDLVKAVSSSRNLPKNVCHDVVTALFTEMADKLTEGEMIRITDFGTFKSADKAERMGRNPKTGEAAVIKARRSVKLKTTGSLEDRLKNV